MKKLYSFSNPIIIIFFVLSYFTSFGQNSVLENGEWYKVAVYENGVYKLTYQDFIAMGFDVSEIAPDKIQIYGNAEGLLPEKNAILVPNELIESAIYVHGSADGSFDEEDYVLFYAVGPNSWEYKRYLQRFKYYGHPYDERNYYFITLGEENGKRIEWVESSPESPLKTIRKYRAYEAHETNLFNFVKSGRKWFGESLVDHPQLVLDFNIPNIDKEEMIKYGIYAASYSSQNGEMIIQPLGSEAQTLSLPKPIGNYARAKESSDDNYYRTEADNVQLTLSYNPPTPSSNAWLDYLEISAVRELKMFGSQMEFNYDVLTSINEIFQFEITNAQAGLKVWEVSDPYSIQEISNYNLNNDSLNFKIRLDHIHYFRAFYEDELTSPELVGPVSNQNLKGLEPFDYAIVTDNDLTSEAQRLADFHKDKHSLRTIVVTTHQIYNEFSGGKQDPTAIRNFLRYHYNKNSQEIDKPKYLLLFGDASYDYKNIIPENINLVPVYQSERSVSDTDTYNTDDYYGIMGQSDGEESKGEIQIAVGRFPVSTIEEARIMVDKTIHYATNSRQNMGEWRNKVCFIADDEDSNLHFNDSNELADYFTADHPEFNVEKIFIDSYVQKNTANGDRYPDVTDAINEKIENGTLFFNYTGHGGHLALTDERIFQISDIVNSKNYDNLGVWIVASCEFGPFDDPNQVSAGEHLVLNPLGGGVALFTTTRLAYASYNFRLNEKFHEIAFSKNTDGTYNRMGDIIRYAKNESGNLVRNFNFVLLGDPALRMAYPEFTVNTTHFNGKTIQDAVEDTIKGRQTINIKGEISTYDSTLVSEFEGELHIKVFGKASTYSTLANDPKSYKAYYSLQDLVIFDGVAEITNGKFDFDFVVPSGISSSIGQGKISYYAVSNTDSFDLIDANGGYADFNIGGIDESIVDDQTGPNIDIHLEDMLFKNGDATSSSPLLMVDLSDENGINTINLGIGKEIKATIDQTNPIILNDYYVPTNYSYKEGKVSFRISDLTEGNHTLTIKAWDMYDNPSEKSINFVVLSDQKLLVYDLINIPNPLFDQTKITFKHNQPNQSEFNVQLKLYDIYGKLVWTYDDKVLVMGNSIEPISFERSNARIGFLTTGIYYYTLEVSNIEQQSVLVKQKMMIVK
jgi:hypothetical protein